MFFMNYFEFDLTFLLKTLRLFLWNLLYGKCINYYSNVKIMKKTDARMREEFPGYGKEGRRKMAISAWQANLAPSPPASLII